MGYLLKEVLLINYYCCRVYKLTDYNFLFLNLSFKSNINFLISGLFSGFGAQFGNVVSFLLKGPFVISRKTNHSEYILSE